MKRYGWAVAVALIAIAGIFYGYQGGYTSTVSVVMLTYQRADMLPKAIDSILAQTYKDFELIILNDGSPDNTKEVVAKYADLRIRYYENPSNKGIAYSRNRVASLARGKYVMIMDDDDRSLPSRMQKQVEYLENHPETTVIAGQIVGLPRIPAMHDDIAAGLIQYNSVGNANIMYRRAFAEKNNIRYNENLKASEDWDFWLKMLFAGAKFAAINEDILERNGASKKHYGINYEDANAPVRENVGGFFSPANPEAFYTADACDKLNMIAPKHIVSENYLQQLLKANNCR